MYTIRIETPSGRDRLAVQNSFRELEWRAWRV